MEQTCPAGAKAVVGNTTVIAEGGYRGTGLLIQHRRESGQAEDVVAPFPIQPEDPGGQPVRQKSQRP